MRRSGLIMLAAFAVLMSAVSATRASWSAPLATSSPPNIVVIGTGGETEDLPAKLAGKAIATFATPAEFSSGAVELSAAKGIWIYPSAFAVATTDQTLTSDLQEFAKAAKPVLFVGSTGEQVLKLIDIGVYQEGEPSLDSRFQPISSSLTYLADVPWSSDIVANFSYGTPQAIDRLLQETVRLSTLGTEG